MKHVFPFQKQNNSFLYEAPDYSLRKQSNKIGFLLCAAIAAMYLFSYALQWFLIGIGYQKSTYNETISILNYLLNGSVLLNDVKKGQPVTTDDVDLSALETYQHYKKGLELD